MMFSFAYFALEERSKDMQQSYNQYPSPTSPPMIRPTQEQKDRQARDIYQFFVVQEAQNSIFTYNDMRSIYPRSVYWYARYRWSWFLKIVARGRQHTFRCQGLSKYPEDYFVLAHQPRQAAFFTHFAEAMRIAKARDQGQNPVSTVTDPEPLEIEDIRKDEEAYLEGDDEVPEEEESQSGTKEEKQSSPLERLVEEGRPSQQDHDRPSADSSDAADHEPRGESTEEQVRSYDLVTLEQKRRRRWLLLAALIVIVMIVGWILWRNRLTL